MDRKENVKIAFIGGPDLSLRMSFLKLLAVEGYEMHGIGSATEEAALFSENGIPYTFYPLKRRFGPAAELVSLTRLYAVLRNGRYDLVHAFDTKPAILGRIAAGLAGVPVIVGTVPGMGSLFSEEGLVNRMLGTLYLLGQKLACHISDATVFQNTDDKRYFVAKKVVPSSKAVLIKGSGVDVKRFSPESVRKRDLKRLEEELGYKPSVIRVLMISRLLRSKGVGEFIKAAEILRAKHDNVHFYLVGPPDASRSGFPLEKIEKDGCNVRYLGQRKDVPELVYYSDMVVLPTYYREGIPRVLMEAASMGRPVVATDIAGCRDAVEHGKTGYLVPPRQAVALADAIERLALDADLRRRMGELARRKMQSELSLDIVYRETLALYERLLAQRKNKDG